jgi:hypothetical protein
MYIGVKMNEKLRECLHKSRAEYMNKRVIICKAKDFCENRLPDQKGRFCRLSPDLMDSDMVSGGNP